MERYTDFGIRDRDLNMHRWRVSHCHRIPLAALPDESPPTLSSRQKLVNYWKPALDAFKPSRHAPGERWDLKREQFLECECERHAEPHRVNDIRRSAVEAAENFCLAGLRVRKAAPKNPHSSVDVLLNDSRKLLRIGDE